VGIERVVVLQTKGRLAERQAGRRGMVAERSGERQQADAVPKDPLKGTDGEPFPVLRSSKATAAASTVSAVLR
jgi:hypothetical protein